MRAPTLAIAFLAVVSTTACSDIVGTDPGLDEAEVIEVADALINTGFEVTGEVATANASTSEPFLALSLADTVTATTTFTTTRTCPSGGQVVLDGTRQRTWDRANHSGSSDLSVTKTHEACARPVRSGDVTITLDGAPNVALEAHHAWQDGQRAGLQTLSLNGAIDWQTDDDRSGTCTIDLSVTYDPENRTRTATGQVCNRTIDRTTTWSNTSG